MRSLSSAIILVCTAASTSTGAEPIACGAPPFDAEVRVEHVIDGDTVVLSGGERLRLIGIDTPELGRDGAAPQPGAEAARAALVNFVAAADTLHISADAEPRDAHGRMLAHLFLGDGSNVQARLLREGFAVPLTIPPNLAFVDCYTEESDAALASGRGLWQLPAYQPVAAGNLDPGTRGYRVVRGRVSRIGRSRSSLWVNLGPAFALRILAGDRAQFRDMQLEALEGQAIEARGLIYSRNRQLRMRIRHPADLRVSPGEPGAGDAVSK